MCVKGFFGFVVEGVGFGEDFRKVWGYDFLVFRSFGLLIFGLEKVRSLILEVRIGYVIVVIDIGGKGYLFLYRLLFLSCFF